jgi:hypothetical protein
VRNCAGAGGDRTSEYFYHLPALEHSIANGVAVIADLQRELHSTVQLRFHKGGHSLLFEVAEGMRHESDRDGSQLAAEGMGEGGGVGMLGAGG